jgi:hypothetical protein
MRWFSFLAVAAVLIIFHAGAAARADLDISPRVVSGRIATYGFDDGLPPASALTPDVHRVFEFGFEDPLSPNSTEDPGVHALATTSGFIPSGLPNGAKMGFDVFTNLLYWNGTGAVSPGAVPSGETLQLGLGSTVTVGSGPGFYAGFLIGTIGSDGDQGLHVHLNSTLNGVGAVDPADGIYLIGMQLRLMQADGTTPFPGIDASLPFYVLYDHGAAAGAIEDAVAYAEANLVPEPPTIVLSGLGGLLVAGGGWRRRRYSPHLSAN